MRSSEWVFLQCDQCQHQYPHRTETTQSHSWKKPYEDRGLWSHIYNPRNSRGHQKLGKAGVISQGWFTQRDQDLKTAVSWMSVLLSPAAYCPDTWNQGPLPSSSCSRSACLLLSYSLWNSYYFHRENFLDLVCSTHHLITHKHVASSTVRGLEHQSLCLNTTSKVRKR